MSCNIIEDDFVLSAEDIVANDLISLERTLGHQPIPPPSPVPTLPVQNDGLDSFISELLQEAATADDEISSDRQTVSNEIVPPCTNDGCHIPDYKAIWKSFADMDTNQRVCVIRNMLFATTSPKGLQNELGAGTKAIKKAAQRKQKRGGSSRRSTMVYTVRGAKICRDAFSHLVSLDDKTVERHASKTANGAGVVIDVSKRSESRKGKHGIQRLVAAGFLFAYASSNGRECPTGRGSSNDRPLTLLPSCTTKVDVHDEYKKAWPSIMEAALECANPPTTPNEPLSYNLFRRYWEQDFPTLKIAKSGSDFCDLCTALKDDLLRIDVGDERHHHTKRLLETHRQEAKQEFLFYKTCQSEAACQPHCDKRHFVFDFAEKVLLPRLQKQPGQLHFVTGLKFDFFGISSSNEGLNYLFGLPEGHWPNAKTANVVCSMLHHLLQGQRSTSSVGGGTKCLQLHADNCSGQNKNRFVFWYCLWRVLMGFDEKVELYFLVAGHTKNVCDGAFGHVKRHLKRTEVRTPAEMMRVIDNSSSTTKCIPSVQVNWFQWKDYLSLLFRMPSTFQITRYHCFTMERSAPGIVKAKALSNDTAVDSFNLLQKGKSGSIVRGSWASACQNELFIPNIRSLADVPSAQHMTRKNYLTVNILNRYYQNDVVLRGEYFEHGKRGLEET